MSSSFFSNSNIFFPFSKLYKIGLDCLYTTNIDLESGEKATAPTFEFSENLYLYQYKSSKSQTKTVSYLDLAIQDRNWPSGDKNGDLYSQSDGIS